MPVEGKLVGVERLLGGESVESQVVREGEGRRVEGTEAGPFKLPKVARVKALTKCSL